MSRNAHTPPIAPRQPIARNHHGDVFDDPYEWLRDKDAPQTRDYLEAENRFTEAATQQLEALRGKIFDDIVARTQQTDLSVPEFCWHHRRQGESEVRTGWWYYSRTIEGMNYRVHCRVPGNEDQMPDPDAVTDREQVLLDGNRLAEGKDFFSLGAFDVSPDGRVLAYAADYAGDERYELRFVDLDSGEALGDAVDDVVGAVAWAGNEHLFFLRANQAWRPYQLWRHRLGSPADTDTLVYTEDDDRFWMGIDSSRDESFLLLSLGSLETSEVRLLPTDDPEGEFGIVSPRREGLLYDVEVAGDRLLIVHNANAQDFELAEAPLDSRSADQWRPVLAHTPGVRLVGADAYAGHVVVNLRRDAMTGVHVLSRNANGDLDTGTDLDFDEPLYTVSAGGGAVYDSDRLRLWYASLVTPTTVLEHRVTTGERRILRQTPVLDHPVHGPFRGADYRQVRTWATAADGTKIPMSIVHHKDVALDGSAPAVIYGYGAYEISIDPTFSISRLSLLDRGFVYAIAHVRGGGELGRAWYDNGRRLHKTNTFTDFVSCARHLVREGYTTADRLAAQGGSAGGMLMGAIANLAPGDFAAIHAAVPFVDCLTTILDPSLPLTVGEWDEWGDPLHDAEVYRYMKSYTPYENVRGVDYPAILATTSLNDTRVYYVEPAKWIAALRFAAANADPTDFMLKTEMVAGHGGVSGRYNAWRDTAFEYAWIIDKVTFGK